MSMAARTDQNDEPDNGAVHGVWKGKAVMLGTRVESGEGKGMEKSRGKRRVGAQQILCCQAAIRQGRRALPTPFRDPEM